MNKSLARRLPGGIGIFWIRTPVVVAVPPTDTQVIARTILGIAGMAMNASSIGGSGEKISDFGCCAHMYGLSGVCRR